MNLAKNRVFKYFIEAKEELQKVTWPTRKETTRYTILVIVITIAMAVFFGVADFVFQLGLEELINFSNPDYTNTSQVAPTTETPTVDIGDIETIGENEGSVTIEEAEEAAGETEGNEAAAGEEASDSENKSEE